MFSSFKYADFFYLPKRSKCFIYKRKENSSQLKAHEDVEAPETITKLVEGRFFKSETKYRSY